MRHPGHLTRPDEQAGSDVAVRNAGKQFAAAILASLGYDLDPAICQVLGEANQAKLERGGPDPPAKPDALHAPAHPRCQPEVHRHVTNGRCEVAAGTPGRCTKSGS